MKLTSLECYATETLQCGIDDLTMLDNIYSVLAEDADDREGLFKEFPNPSLNTLLYETYSAVTHAVQEEARKLIENEAMNPEYKNKLTKKAKELTEETPYANCLDTYFQNDLDQTVDWDTTVESNADSLIEYWREEDKKEAKKLWDTFNIPINEKEEIDVDWHIFKKGTPRENIRRWFEEEFGVSVEDDLM